MNEHINNNKKQKNNSEQAGSHTAFKSVHQTKHISAMTVPNKGKSSEVRD